MADQREAWLLLDGVLTDPLSVAALAQQEPWPGGVAFHAVVHGLTRQESRQAADAPESQRLEVLVRLLHGEAPQAGPPMALAYLLNRVDAYALDGQTLDVRGVASPVVNSG